MFLGMIAWILFGIIANIYADDLYPNYNLTIDNEERLDYSDNRALAYISTVRLHDYDHHIYQYRRYPCQYFYTDEIQLHYTNETMNQCELNRTTNDYDFYFQLHLDSRHVEPFILRNIALKCNYTNCSLSLLNITSINIGWSLEGKKNNLNCSFDIHQSYQILRMPYTISEMIRLQCKSFIACKQAKSTLEQAFRVSTELVYNSAFELEVPYCSLERSVRFVVETNFAQTNHLLRQLINVFQQNSTKSNQIGKLSTAIRKTRQKTIKN